MAADQDEQFAEDEAADEFLTEAQKLFSGQGPGPGEKKNEETQQ